MTYALPLPICQATPKGTRASSKAAVPSVICHRMRTAQRKGQANLPLLGGLAIIADRRPMTGSRGAVGRAFCLPNRASHPSTTVGLLRRAWLGMRSNGAGDTRALSRSGKALGLDAGASDTKGLTGVLRASRHASPTQWGPLRPLKPCMNGLPAHAPDIHDCRSRPDCLYACPIGTGLKELH